MVSMDIPPPLTRYIFHNTDMILRPLALTDIGSLHTACYANRSRSETDAKLSNSLYWQEKGERIHLVVETNEGECDRVWPCRALRPQS